jgi:arginyl-tRNA synthetase
MLRVQSYLNQIIKETLQKLNYPEVDFVFDRPRLETHGDISINLAMVLAKELKQNPGNIAAQLINKLDVKSEWINNVEIAEPGFINFFLSKKYLQNSVANIITESGNYGSFKFGKGQKAQVEFVSANPTGPLTVGHGRQAVLGDTLANLLECAGYEVIREYYFNNAGRQMKVLGESVRFRYLEILGEKIEFPDDYYQGAYIKEIAKSIKDQKRDLIKDSEDDSFFTKAAENAIFDDIRYTLNRLKIDFDVFFNESDLYKSGEINSVLKIFKEKNLSYEKEGAVWFKSTEFGLDQDKVIVKNTGEPTYRLPDIAYHKNKLERGFDLIVDLFGADHIGTYPDVLAGIKALGYNPEKIKVLIHQFVTLYEGREKIKMSTRKANFITLDELLDEVGEDVTRWFFLMRSMQSHLNFDLSLAKTESDENPVFYNQYAHARICSIFQNAEEKGIAFKNKNFYNRLEEKCEFELIKKLLEFPLLVQRCITEYEPHLLTQYLSEVSTSFHKFYTECRVIVEDSEMTEARLGLCLATKIVLANGFKILGISAPEKM